MFARHDDMNGFANIDYKSMIDIVVEVNGLEQPVKMKCEGE